VRGEAVSGNRYQAPPRCNRHASVLRERRTRLLAGTQLWQEDWGILDPQNSADVTYKARRDEIAALSHGYVRGEPVPPIDYTQQEHGVWRLVATELASRHQHYATTEFLNAAEDLAIPVEGIPQLQDVGTRLADLTGFGLQPAGGIVPFADFCGSLADLYFQSTQYIRPHTSPHYSTEPDVLHELIGHANALADSRFAALYQVVGEATRRVQTEEALQFIAKTFWFTMECGVMTENGELKAYGASLLSSTGELDNFRDATIKPLDIADLAGTDYDISKYQTLLYTVDSMSELEDTMGTFWSACDDESITRLLTEASTTPEEATP
jgi:phenylalanine-4-hydroxylase